MVPLRSVITFLSLLLLLRRPIVVHSSSGDDDIVVRWASTGGGWRSMFACVGFANVFNQAGLLSEESSRFSAVSTTSGASWFSTQLFYSAEFYRKTALASTPDELEYFVRSWMGAYLAMSNNITEHEECNATDLGGGDDVATFREFCDLLVEYDGDWAAFVRDMLRAASVEYGDNQFVDKLAGSDNRIPALRSTDLLIQSAIVPNSRVRSSDTAVYLGPSDSSNGQVYAVPLSAAYVVRSSDSSSSSSSSSTGFRYGSESDLIAYASPTSSEHSFSDWDGFSLFPGTNGTVAIADPPEAPSTTSTGGGAPLREPFGGGSSTTAVQVAAVSSAAVGHFSGAAPSVFTQGLSEERYEVEETRGRVALNLFDRAVDGIYKNPIFDGFAVCGQWPDPCGEADGRFIDGWFADNPALAINIGQYQASPDADPKKRMKVVLTNTNRGWNNTFDYVQLLQYFNASFNRGVEPGGFNWPPAYTVPLRSPQIFEDYMDEEKLDAMLEPVGGSNMTTAVLTATTTDNAAFGVRAGQTVDVLLINLNEDITTYVVGSTAIERFTRPLAGMTRDIASNEDLISRVREFFGTDAGPEDGEGTPPPTAAPGGTTTPPSSGPGHVMSATILLTSLLVAIMTHV